MLKISHNSKTLPFGSEPIYFGGMLGRTLSHFAKSWHHASHIWGGLLGCWSNNVANSHLSPVPFNSRVLYSCLGAQYSHLPHWICHQRRLANCDWMPAEIFLPPQASNNLELRRKGAILALPRCRMMPWHLLHSALTCPSSGNARPHLFYTRCSTTHQFIWRQ